MGRLWNQWCSFLRVLENTQRRLLYVFTQNFTERKILEIVGTAEIVLCKEHLYKENVTEWKFVEIV